TENRKEVSRTDRVEKPAVSEKTSWFRRTCSAAPAYGAAYAYHGAGNVAKGVAIGAGVIATGAAIDSFISDGDSEDEVIIREIIEEDTEVFESVIVRSGREIVDEKVVEAEVVVEEKSMEVKETVIVKESGKVQPSVFATSAWCRRVGSGVGAPSSSALGAVFSE
ncbi:hypothetical protein BGX34_008329, partial [Mortierella sp. NVP85]